MPTMAKTYSTRNHIRVVTPFKVQVNFEIPLFEGKVDAYALEKWSNLLEGYYFIQKNLDIITLFHSLRPFPMSNIGGKVTRRSMMDMILQNLGKKTLGKLLLMPSRRNSTPLKTIMTITRNGKIFIIERPESVRVHQYLPYLVLRDGYHRIQVAPSFGVSQWPTQVHTNRYALI
jgi:hypothetical protein